MEIAVEVLKDQSHHLLAAVRSGTQDHLLAGLLDSRHREIRALEAALQPGGALSADDVQELQRLDRELIAAVEQRREEIAAELAALERGRRAGMAYRSLTSGASRFVDRAS